MIMLDEQGEQLNRIEEGADQINDAMRQAEKNLTNMEKCCGLCVMPWRKSKSFEKSAEYKNTWKKGGKHKEATINTDLPSSNFNSGHESGGGVANGGFIQRITNDDREDEMEDNLANVAKFVGNLKNMGLDMGNVLESQNKQIDRIQDKTDATDLRIKKGVQRTNDILRKA
jgi:hypothetical protein